MIDITKIIQEHGSGALFLELNDSMQRLVQDCVETGKKGKLQLALVVEPVSSRDGHQVKITPGVTSNNPKYDSGVEFLYVVTDENNKAVGLEAQDPRQIEMFKTIEREKKEQL
jgi:hypothetical protein